MYECIYICQFRNDTVVLLNNTHTQNRRVYIEMKNVSNIL